MPDVETARSPVIASSEWNGQHVMTCSDDNPYAMRGSRLPDAFYDQAGEVMAGGLVVTGDAGFDAKQGVACLSHVAPRFLTAETMPKGHLVGYSVDRETLAFDHMKKPAPQLIGSQRQDPAKTLGKWTMCPMLAAAVVEPELPESDIERWCKCLADPVCDPVPLR